MVVHDDESSIQNTEKYLTRRIVRVTSVRIRMRMRRLFGKTDGIKFFREERPWENYWYELRTLLGKALLGILVTENIRKKYQFVTHFPSGSIVPAFYPISTLYIRSKWIIDLIQRWRVYFPLRSILSGVVLCAIRSVDGVCVSVYPPIMACATIRIPTQTQLQQH